MTAVQTPTKTERCASVVSVKRGFCYSFPPL
jgi:hypothetical protein